MVLSTDGNIYGANFNIIFFKNSIFSIRIFSIGFMFKIVLTKSWLLFSIDNVGSLANDTTSFSVIKNKTFCQNNIVSSKY